MPGVDIPIGIGMPWMLILIRIRQTVRIRPDAVPDLQHYTGVYISFIFANIFQFSIKT